jgi:hypothetical protein
MADDNVISLDDREEAMFRARVRGQSLSSIAREFHCTIAHVEAAIDQRCTPINEHLRRHTLLLELARAARHTGESIHRESS